MCHLSFYMKIEYCITGIANISLRQDVSFSFSDYNLSTTEHAITYVWNYEKKKIPKEIKK